MQKKALVLWTSLALAMPLMALTNGLASAETVGISQDAQEPIQKVDLNQAGVEELMELPGIGEKVAARIVRYREENGPFQAPEELMNVRGIGEKTYLKLESRLTVTTERKKEE